MTKKAVFWSGVNRWKPGFAQHPGPALLDSSFRWNDEGVLFGFFLIHSLSRHFGLSATARLDDGCLAPRPVVIPAKAGIQWFM